MAADGGWRDMYYELRHKCAQLASERNSYQDKFAEAERERGRLSMENARLKHDLKSLRARNAELERWSRG